jgi:hypothetical protein
MSLTHAQYTTRFTRKLQGWQHRQPRRLPDTWRNAALVLLASISTTSRPEALAPGNPCNSTLPYPERYVQAALCRARPCYGALQRVFQWSLPPIDPWNTLSRHRLYDHGHW